MLAAVLLLLLACSTGKQSTWDPVGPVAERQLLLFNVLLWVMVAVFILVEGILLYAAVRYRRRPGQGLPNQTHGNTPLEIAWTIVPTILIMALGIWSVITLYQFDEPPASANNVLHVNVTGHQWWFEFEYEDAGAGKRIVTANELKIPVDRAVRLTLESDDVLHSFWVPKLAGKTDMVPGEGNYMWFEADVPGEYYGQCAEYCGTSHANMKFKVIAVSEPDFKSWLQVQSNPALESSDPLVQEGAGVFKSAGCTGCHATKTVVNKGSKGRVGPNLAHVASRRDLAAGMLRNSDDNGSVNDAILQKNLRTWLQDPNEVKPGNLMSSGAQVYTDPDKKLTEEQISQLVHYLSSLK